MIIITKRNVNAFSLNPIVDVRLRRRIRRRYSRNHFLNISETTRASNFNI